MSLISLAAALIKGPEPELAVFTMAGFDDDGEDAVPERELQFWPETISETISPVFIDKIVPGGSHPIKQWAYNGGRTISFTILIARDIRPKELLPFGVDALINPQSPDNAPYNHDVRSDLAWLRSFCYPTYAESEGITIAKPPPKIMLVAEGLALGHDGSDVFECVMTSLSINHMRSYNEGFPRMATADLSFAEIVQPIGSPGEVQFHDREEIMQASFYATPDEPA